ncbi:MAG: formate/nitrite transporter family protein [Alphaproteobacteria bacterium]|nr:formate/nitrite transporter family protein [Alphaproteobacteria bacterium]
MYQDAINKCIAKAEESQAKSLFQLLLGGIMAGAYIGFAVLLVFTLANVMPDSLKMLVMGAFFGVGLVLIIVAGADLFTGYTMFISVALLNKKIKLGKAVQTMAIVWFANLLGSVFVALLYMMCSTNLLNADSLVHVSALNKTTYDFWALFFRAILCNWLVCLAIWMSFRTSETGKYIATWWCLFAFVVCGYEHCVANMTLLSLSYLGEHSDQYTLMGILYNLSIATLGNLISGMLFVGWAYNKLNQKAAQPEAAN